MRVDWVIAHRSTRLSSYLGRSSARQNTFREEVRQARFADVYDWLAMLTPEVSRIALAMQIGRLP
jgi:hypothetical protein